MEFLFRFQDALKFYQKRNASHLRVANWNRSTLKDKRLIIERWKPHYDEHQNTGTECQDSENDDYVSTANSMGINRLSRWRDVKDAIQHLKNIKAGGKNGIRAELIKMGPERSTAFLRRLKVRIWETE